MRRIIGKFVFVVTAAWATLMLVGLSLVAAQQLIFRAPVGGGTGAVQAAADYLYELLDVADMSGGVPEGALLTRIGGQWTAFDPGSCGPGQILAWNAGSWMCSDDSGVGSETDPSVGTVNDGEWCVGSGTQVACDRAKPFSQVQRRTCTATANRGNAGCTATCNPGETVVGGGAEDKSGGVRHLLTNYPSASNAWTCASQWDAGDPTSDSLLFDLVCFALCAS